MAIHKPKHIAFDLNYTLWPFKVDTHVDPPFKKGPNGDDIIDACGRIIKYYPEVPGILQDLHGKGYILAVVSRTNEIMGANQLLELFGWNKFFTYKEIYSGCKITHFMKLKEESGFEFKDMLFFDNEDRNIRDVQQIGVTSILVPNGVDKHNVEDGLKEYARQHSIDK